MYDEIASGGMATVHLGKLLGEGGFTRTVAIKRLHVHYAKDPDFVTMFMDEARVAARVHHPNVVSTLDVVFIGGELFLVMEYVMGESLARLIPLTRQQGQYVPPAIAGTVMAGVLHGLHAAHEARDERGMPLGIVHRDVSPQNVLVGVDGTARVLDFGVAKAVGRMQETRQGQLKGKIAYMAPEQIGGTVDRTSDVYSASVVLWEMLAGKRLFQGDSEVEAMKKVLAGCSQPPSAYAPDIPPALDQITMRGLQLDPTKRFATAGEMALAIEEAVPLVAASRIGRWVQQTAAQRIAVRAERIAAMESSSAIRGPRPPLPSGTHNDPILTPVSGERVVPSAPVPVIAPAIRPSGWRVAVPIAAVLLTLAAAAAAVLVWQRRQHHPTATSAVPTPETTAATIAPGLSAASSPTASSPPASSEEPSAGAAPPPDSASPATISVTSLPSATTAAPPARRTQLPVGTARAPVATAKASAAARPGAECNPPYYFNAQGDRIFKQECL
jgi:serine/threonine-protein kinase